MRKSFLMLLTLVLMSFAGHSQLIKDRTNGKFTMGFDLFSDINTGSKYENFNMRTINQGFGTYITYNFPMGESKHTVSLGLGITSHNYYIKKAWLAEPYNYEITFTEGSVKKSKININYFDIPLEVNFRIADKFKISFGAKVEFLMSSRTKVRGDVYGDGHQWEVKYGSINALENIVYSTFARVGYRAVNIFVGYQLTNTFKKDRGPQLLPFSIGIGLRAY